MGQGLRCFKSRNKKKKNELWAVCQQGRKFEGLRRSKERQKENYESQTSGKKKREAFIKRRGKQRGEMGA